MTAIAWNKIAVAKGLKRMALTMRNTFVGVVLVSALSMRVMGFADSTLQILPLSSLPISIDVSNHVCVNAYLNGKGPFRFLLDTGLTGVTITPEVAQKLNIDSSRGNLTQNAFGQVSWLPECTVNQLQIGKETLSNLTANIVFCGDPGVDGVIGYPFFSKFVVEFDFVNNVVNLYDPTDFEDDNAGSVRFRFNLDSANIPVLAAGVDGNSTFARVDTGCESEVLATTRTVGDIVAADPELSGGSTIVSPGGTSTTRRYQLRALTVGDQPSITISGVPADVQDNTNDDPDGCGIRIGLPLFLKYKTIFFYGEDSLILDPANLVTSVTKPSRKHRSSNI